jgi:hypothetical protein
MASAFPALLTEMLFDRLVWDYTHATYGQYIKRIASGCHQLNKEQGGKPAVALMLIQQSGIEIHSHF